MQSSWFFWLISRCFSSYAAMHFWLLWTAKASAVQSSKFVHLICYDLLGKTRIFLSVKFHLLRFAVCLHLIYFTVCDIRARARHKTAQCYYFCYAAVIRSLCVQFMSFSNFAFCAKLTKIYSYDTTGQNAKFFCFFYPSFSVPRALCHFILWNACLR